MSLSAKKETVYRTVSEARLAPAVLNTDVIVAVSRSPSIKSAPSIITVPSVDLQSSPQLQREPPVGEVARMATYHYRDATPSTNSNSNSSRNRNGERERERVRDREHEVGGRAGVPITHIVLFKYRSDVGWADLQAHFDDFLSLPARCLRDGRPYVRSLKTGTVPNFFDTMAS